MHDRVICLFKVILDYFLTMNHSLQIARGIAAIIVCFHHLFLGPYFKIYPDSILKATHINILGGLAVYFFFALSGYVLTLSINKKLKMPRPLLKKGLLEFTLSIYYGHSWLMFYGRFREGMDSP